MLDYILFPKANTSDEDTVFSENIFIIIIVYLIKIVFITLAITDKGHTLNIEHVGSVTFKVLSKYKSNPYINIKGWTI
jgi:hypothetical protein